MPDINTRITDYNRTITQKVEMGLLDIWGRLGEYRDFLVVIGGLVPRYIDAMLGLSAPSDNAASRMAQKKK